MNRKTSVTLLVLTLSSIAAFQAVSPAKEPAAGSEPSVTQTPASEPVVETPAPEKALRAVDPATLPPMHREIFDAVEAERKQVEELNDRFLGAVLPGEKLAIQKEIEAAKKNGMIAVLEIQLRYAESEGRTETAAQLTSAIEAVRNPKPLLGTGQTLLEKAGAPAVR